MNPEVLQLTIEHLLLVLTAIVAAIMVAVPGGVWLTRRERWRAPLLGFAGILQTIPSLALFGFLIPVPRIGGIEWRTQA